MFEFSVASKYLIPRWKQISVSLISLVSCIVISLVVWLIIVFFSVTEGLEENWVNRLIALTAPVRVTPTPAYIESYYYRIDQLASASQYTSKTLGEKKSAPQTNPYDASLDAEVPGTWSPPDLDEKGQMKDIVKLAFDGIDHIEGVSGLVAKDYEVAVANIRIKMAYPQSRGTITNTHVNQNSYVASFEEGNPRLKQALIDVSMEDLSHLMQVLSQSAQKTEDTEEVSSPPAEGFSRERLLGLLNNIHITHLQTPKQGWRIPRRLIPASARFDVCAIISGDRIKQMIIPADTRKVEKLVGDLTKDGYICKVGTLIIREGAMGFTSGTSETYSFSPFVPLIVESGVNIRAQLLPDSLEKASEISDIEFDAEFHLQGIPFRGQIRYGSLQIGIAEIVTKFDSTPKYPPLWTYEQLLPDGSVARKLPSDEHLGEGVLLPKHFIESGVRVGDSGYLSYMTPTASSVQEQRIAIFVSGFYDPGILPIGGKFVMIGKDTTTLARAAQGLMEDTEGNGINVWFDDIGKADKVKSAIEQAFKERGIDRYWRITTYREFDFTRDLIRQLQSEKNLFTLLALIIIVVACSNIITMLILLVNDKKTEIGILRSMGASPGSIAAIFGTCGVVMGMAGSLVGMAAALVTLHYLQPIVDFIGRVQGYEMFNTMFYGDALPNKVSAMALMFVFFATLAISLLAGLIPAIKATLMKPSAILRSE